MARAAPAAARGRPGAGGVGAAGSPPLSGVHLGGHRVVQPRPARPGRAAASVSAVEHAGGAARRPPGRQSCWRSAAPGRARRRGRGRGHRPLASRLGHGRQQRDRRAPAAGRARGGAGAIDARRCCCTPTPWGPPGAWRPTRWSPSATWSPWPATRWRPAGLGHADPLGVRFAWPPSFAGGGQERGLGPAPRTWPAPRPGRRRSSWRRRPRRAARWPHGGAAGRARGGPGGDRGPRGHSARHARLSSHCHVPSRGCARRSCWSCSTRPGCPRRPERRAPRGPLARAGCSRPWGSRRPGPAARSASAWPRDQPTTRSARRFEIIAAPIAQLRR